VKPEPRKPAESKPPGQIRPAWCAVNTLKKQLFARPKEPSSGWHYTRPAHESRRSHGPVVPIDIVNAIAGETALPGKVRWQREHPRAASCFVDVASDHANAILA